MRGTATLLFALSLLNAADYKAGLAAVNITPEKPIYLSGYGNRKHPSEGVLSNLYARALAIEDLKGGRVVIVTTDLIGLPRNLSEVIAARAQINYKVERPQLLLNSSHTHSGPLIRHNLQMMFELNPEEEQAVLDYSEQLIDKLVTLVGAALKDLSPADLSFGNGEAHFAVNRREPTPKGVIIGVNPKGPTDPDVPVLRVTSPDGKLRAVLFGYACHNVTLTGENYSISGDYAGYAESALEKRNSGAVAMFIMLCGGDQNPNPRGTGELAERHGETLAAEAGRVMEGRMQRVRGPIVAAFQVVDLSFARHSQDTFSGRLNDPDPVRVRHAKAMLKTYEMRSPVRRYPYPVQAIRFGKDLTLLALGGEVVVDYVLRVKKEYGSKGIIVAGYSNDVMSYIPSKRVLHEGGYEPDKSMIYYGLPGPYDDYVEERVFGTVYQVMNRVGALRGRHGF